MVKINRLEIENAKRIRAVALEPSENGLTVIGGKNGQGKTSVLDCIAWALGGAKFAPSAPAREGSVTPPYLRVELSNGLVVERRGKNSELKVTDPSGRRAGQQLLDSFVSAFALDLPRFLHAGNAAKAETLLQVIGVKEELQKLDNDIRRTYSRRHELGRIADQKAKFAEELPWWDGVPAEPVSAAELILQQQEILARNGEKQRLRANAARLEARREDVLEQIRRTKDVLARLTEEADRVLADLAEAQAEATGLVDESTAQLEESIRNIDAVNIKVRQNMEKVRAQEEAAAMQGEYDDLTDELAALRASRLALLQGAKLPLEGLLVDEDGELTYHGHRWDGLSGAEQLRVAAGIVRAVQPECGFVLMDKLEQMDTDTLAEFGAWLEAEGLQAIATRVSTGGECSIIIEDGYVQGGNDPLPPAEAPPAAGWTAKSWKDGEF